MHFRRNEWNSRHTEKRRGMERCILVKGQSMDHFDTATSSRSSINITRFKWWEWLAIETSIDTQLSFYSSSTLFSFSPFVYSLDCMQWTVNYTERYLSLTLSLSLSLSLVRSTFNQNNVRLSSVQETSLDQFTDDQWIVHFYRGFSLVTEAAVYPRSLWTLACTFSIHRGVRQNDSTVCCFSC